MRGRCLIVANQTLGGEALDREIRDRLGRGVSSFYVVVPLTPVECEAPDWEGGFGLGEDAWMSPDRASVAVEENARQRGALQAEARRRAQRRLDLMIARVRPVGATADGEVGSDDPSEATRAALERQARFDEIIVSTLPGGLSRWLKMDLPARVAAMTALPVTTIEANAS